MCMERALEEAQDTAFWRVLWDTLIFLIKVWKMRIRRGAEINIMNCKTANRRAVGIFSHRDMPLLTTSSTPNSFLIMALSSKLNVLCTHWTWEELGLPRVKPSSFCQGWRWEEPVFLPASHMCTAGWNVPVTKACLGMQR